MHSPSREEFKLWLCFYSPGAVNMCPAGNNSMRFPVCFTSALKWMLSASRGHVNKQVCFKSAAGVKSWGRGNKR